MQNLIHLNRIIIKVTNSPAGHHEFVDRTRAPRGRRETIARTDLLDDLGDIIRVLLICNTCN